MPDDKSQSPLSLSTKIDLKWLLVVVFIFGASLATESVSRASFEAEARARDSRLEQAVSNIQDEVKSINNKMNGICVDIAVIKNDYKHVVGLLEDLKKHINE